MGISALAAVGSGAPLAALIRVVETLQGTASVSGTVQRIVNVGIVTLAALAPFAVSVLAVQVLHKQANRPIP